MTLSKAPPAVVPMAVQQANKPFAQATTRATKAKGAKLRCGTVVLVGQPNVGKSTLLNRLVDVPLAIVTPKAQTTRTPLRGIVQRPAGQMIVLDTAGIVAGKQPFARAIRYGTEQAMAQADVLAWVVDATASKTELLATKAIVQDWRNAFGEQKPFVIVCNKIDRLASKQLILPLLAQMHDWFADAILVPIAANLGDGLACLEEQLWQQLPFGQPLFDATAYTDASERYLCAELIREQLLWATQQEVPHSAAVLLENFQDERTSDGGRVWLDACIVVNSVGQKGIVIGRSGQMIKTIGMRARAKIEQLLQAGVVLRLRVALDKNWKDNPRSIGEYGIGSMAQATSSFTAEQPLLEQMESSHYHEHDSGIQPTQVQEGG